MALTTAAAIIGGSIIGGASSAIGASKAAKAAKSAQNTATQESQRQFDLVRQDTAPLRLIGNNAIGQLSKLYGYGTPNADGTASNSTPDMTGFFTSPDYTFNLAEGQKAIDRSAAARGGLLSGAAVKAGTRYASGLAAGQFSAYVDRLMQQAGLGNTGIAASANAGANSASLIGSAALNAGNTRASAYSGMASGVNNAIQGGLGNYLLSQYMSPSGSTASYPVAMNYTGPKYAGLG